MIDVYHVLLQAILVPMAFSVVTLVLGKAMSKHVGWLAFVALAYSTCLLAKVMISLPNLPGNFLEAVYYWGPYLGDLSFTADGLSTPIALTIAILCTLISIYSMGYMEHEPHLNIYFSLYLLYSASMIATVLTTNLAAFFFFFELMLIPSWALVGIWGTGPRERIAFKYFMFTEAGALSMLGGIVVAYFLSGTFNLMEMAPRLARYDVSILTIVMVAMLLGLLVKMAIFPLHTWLPDAHAEAPTPISALLSPAMIGIGGYAIIRIAYTALPMVLTYYHFVIALAILAMVTMIYGGIMALAQDDIKRLLAYSSISQMGYLLFGIASISTMGLIGSILFYINHGFCKAVLFMMAGVMMHSLHMRSISKLGGLAPKMPLTAIASLVAFIGLAGVPPIVGFWGEVFIFAGSMETAFLKIVSVDVARAIVTSIAIVATILTASYGLWTMRRVFYGQLTLHVKGEVGEASMLLLIPIMISASLAVIMGIYPTIVTEPASLWASEVIKSLRP